jgi:long-subunit fatty acid transport protein
MKKILVLFCFLVSVVACYSQPSQSQDLLINPFWDFYAENSLSSVNSGKGNTGTASENDLSGIMLNPASLEMPEMLQASVSYEFKSNVQWMPEVSSDLKLRQVHPELLAGVGYRINDKFSIGLVYQNNYSFKLDFGEFITTNEFGQRTGSYTAYQRYTTNTITVPIVYKYKYLKAGVNLSVMNYKGFDNLSQEIIVGNEKGGGDNNASFWKFIPMLGITLTPVEQFSFGASYSPPYEEAVEWDYADPDQIGDPVYFPEKVNVGTELRLLKKKLIFDLDYRFQNTSRSYMLRDRHDLYFGMQYALEPNFTVRTGFFTLLDYRTNDKGANFIDPIGSLNQYFLTIGGTYKTKDFATSFSIMTSNIITTPDVASTRIQATLTYNICECNFR